MQKKNRLPFALGALLIVVSSVTSCGLVPEQGSCDRRPAEAVCEDLLTNRNNQLRMTFDSLCSLGDGTFSDDLCDHAGALGGCHCEGCENGETITWYFAGAGDGEIQTREDVMALCDEAGRDFVEP